MKNLEAVIEEIFERKIKIMILLLILFLGVIILSISYIFFL